MQKILSQSVKTLRLYIRTQNCVPMQVSRITNCVYIVAPTHVETVCLLSREKEVKRYVHVDITPEELGMQEGGKTVKHPTYKQIKEYVKATHGLNVSPLYIATVKEECGLEKQFSYKEAGMEAGRRPNCPPEKREAIIDAFVHFGMMGK